MDISRSGAGLWSTSSRRFTHEFFSSVVERIITQVCPLFLFCFWDAVCGTITPLVSFRGDTLFFKIFAPPPLVHLHDFCDITHAIVFRFVEWLTRFRHFEKCTGLQGKKRDVPGHVNRENQVHYILSNE